MKTVLFFYDDSNLPVACSRELSGLYSFARTQNWAVQAISGRFTARKVRALLAFWQPAGVIVSSGGPANLVDPRVFAPTPVVFLDRNPKTLPAPAFCVMHDSAATARFAARELLALGLGHYAYVPWPEPRFWCADRERGFAAALRMHGRGYLRFPAKGNAADALALQAQLAKWLGGLPKPVGIFAANDRMAEAVLTAARRCGIDVPHDVAVVGVDNDETLCENAKPTLTSVLPDFEAAGAKAAELLAAQLANGKAKPRTETFGPLRLVRRSSSNRQAKKTDGDVLAACDLIRRRACDGLRARDVLLGFDCSRRMAELRFRAAVGHSVLDEIQAVRLQKAQDLMRDRTLDLSAIANFCGYASANALRNFLRKHPPPPTW